MALCLECEKPFDPPIRETNRGNGKYCTRACVASANNRLRPSRKVKLICQTCGCDYEIKNSQADGSKYCSRVCLDASKVRTGEQVARAAAFALIPNQCDHCMVISDLVLHHRDGNHFNNDPSNWQIVCRACHLMVSHGQHKRMSV